MTSKEYVYDFLFKQNIPFEVSNHLPIETIGVLFDLELKDKTKIAKNLFLRNDNGKKHYLITVRQDKEVDLKDLRKKIGSSRLSFASEKRLKEHLGLEKGAVSPLGVINDLDKDVLVFFDEDLKDEAKIGVHPNENDATVWLSFENIKKIVNKMGNKFSTVKIKNISG